MFLVNKTQTNTHKLDKFTRIIFQMSLFKPIHKIIISTSVGLMSNLRILNVLPLQTPASLPQSELDTLANNSQEFSVDREHTEEMVTHISSVIVKC